MSFWLPAIGGALFILAGAWWIAAPVFRPPGSERAPSAREPDLAGVMLDAGGR